jgi:hypothetical protein
MTADCSLRLAELQKIKERCHGGTPFFFDIYDLRLFSGCSTARIPKPVIVISYLSCP